MYGHGETDKALKSPQISPETLAYLGMDSLAYVRPLTVNGRKVHVIHAADGTPLAVVTDRELAFITVRQHEMQPQSIH